MRCVIYLLTFIFLIQMIYTTSAFSNATISDFSDSNKKDDNDFLLEIEKRLGSIGGKLKKYDEEIFNPEGNDYKSTEILNEIMNEIYKGFREDKEKKENIENKDKKDKKEDKEKGLNLMGLINPLTIGNMDLSSMLGNTLKGR